MSLTKTNIFMSPVTKIIYRVNYIICYTTINSMLLETRQSKSSVPGWWPDSLSPFADSLWFFEDHARTRTGCVPLCEMSSSFPSSLSSGAERNMTGLVCQQPTIRQ